MKHNKLFTTLLIIFVIIIVLFGTIVFIVKYLFAGIELISCVVDVKACAVERTESADALEYTSNINKLKPFKYTIDADFGSEILVAINSMNGFYPVKYDLDCDGDGEYEFTGLTDNHKCSYPRKFGKHQIWVRGQIPGMWLCARRMSKNARGIIIPFGEIAHQVCDEVNIAPTVDPDTTPMGIYVQKLVIFACSHPVGSKIESKAVVSVDDWGDIEWKTMSGFAAECKNLKHIPKQSPNLKNVRNMSGMFALAESFNQTLNNWNVSQVTDMSFMFKGAKSFNQPLNHWNVSKVEYMTGMFEAASSFNQILDNWDVSNVKNMVNMFVEARSFNHYPSSWVIPEDNPKDSESSQVVEMFSGTKVEDMARKEPLKTHPITLK